MFVIDVLIPSKDNERSISAVKPFVVLQTAENQAKKALLNLRIG
jgi:hypothetical protein